MIVPAWFLYIAGFALVVLGVLQIQARPRKKHEGPVGRFVNLGTFWSLLCITVGTAVVLIALGYWTPDFAAKPKPKPTAAKKYRQ
jgi:hypothetical protein